MRLTHYRNATEDYQVRKQKSCFLSIMLVVFDAMHVNEHTVNLIVVHFYFKFQPAFNDGTSIALPAKLIKLFLYL